MAKQVNIVDDILPHDLCDELIFKYHNKPSSDKTNHQAWSPDIVDHSTVVLVNELNNHEMGRIMPFVHDALPFLKNYYFIGMFYRWTHLSYIPIHNDGHVDQALTIHLNPDYSVREGGLFLYRINDSDPWTGIEPIHNRLVHTEKADHMVTPVTSHRPRLSLQLFNLRVGSC